MFEVSVDLFLYSVLASPIFRYVLSTPEASDNVFNYL